jgi:hypothetical protein
MKAQSTRGNGGVEKAGSIGWEGDRGVEEAPDKGVSGIDQACSEGRLPREKRGCVGVHNIYQDVEGQEVSKRGEKAIFEEGALGLRVM